MRKYRIVKYYNRYDPITPMYRVEEKRWYGWGTVFQQFTSESEANEWLMAYLKRSAGVVWEQ